MSRLLKIALVLTVLLPLSARAQSGFDVFVPISKYFAQGDADKLSSWFADNLEITIISRTSDSSRSQARQMVKSFFENYSPRSFEINHTASNGNTKYALGALNAGGQTFLVTIFVSLDEDTYKIQQLKIDAIR